MSIFEVIYQDTGNLKILEVFETLRAADSYRDILIHSGMPESKLHIEKIFNATIEKMGGFVRIDQHIDHFMKNVCPNQCKCITDPDYRCSWERYQYGYWPYCVYPLYFLNHRNGIRRRLEITSSNER